MRPIVQNSTFGRRVSQPFADTSASSPTTLPIKIERDIGIKASTLFGAVLWAIFVTTLPLLLDKGALADVLFHSSSAIIDLGLLVLAPVFYLLSRNPGELEISSQGVGVATKKSGRWFYNWGDIESVVETPKGVRLLLKGRSDAQNLYNLIPSGFGLKPPELSSIITEGISRYGAAGSHSSIKTVSPGDDLQVTRIRSIKQTVSVFGFIFGGLFAAMVIWQALECMKTLDLQKNGRSTEARVIRTYTAGCGKRSCSINVEYAFTPEPAPGDPRIEYRGYEYIADSRRPNDPDLGYARTNGTVPIVYDVNRPATSGLNFRNRVFAKNPVSSMFDFLGIFGGIEALIMALFLASLLPTILKARKAAD
jgi:hypothetical protein